MPRIFFDDELHLIRLVYNIVQATQKIMRRLQRENQNTHRVKTQNQNTHRVKTQSQNTHRVKTEITTQNSEQCQEYFLMMNCIS